MGTSTNGLLYYGFDFLTEDEGDATQELTDFLGLEDDEKEPYYDVTHDNPHIRIDYHGSDGYPVWFIAYKPLSFTALRGYPEAIDLKMLNDQDYAAIDKILQAFCEEHNIPWQQPHWRLASYWG